MLSTLPKPDYPYFSSGPCKKPNSWSLDNFDTACCHRSHRSTIAKRKINQILTLSRQLLNLPNDWHLAITPASDTGSFELAMWNLLGERHVDVFSWESFSSDWAEDIRTELAISHSHYHADYGYLPDLTNANPDHDIVFAYNGTTSGVMVPNLDWISPTRQGLVFCDATSAAFAIPLNFQQLDVVTWSWQKVLGSEGGFGMLALSPKAMQRLQQYTPTWPLPKIFRLKQQNKIKQDFFQGGVINTISMLAVEDVLQSLQWFKSLPANNNSYQKTAYNAKILADWVAATPWIDWLAKEPTTRSLTSPCLQIVDPVFLSYNLSEQQNILNNLLQQLEQQQVAFDIKHYKKAPIGLRIWTASTINHEDLTKLFAWLNNIFYSWQQTIN